MRSCLCVLSVLLFGSAAVHAQGLMVPEDKSLTPLAVVKHHVNIAIDEQVATTRVEQVFRNPTDRQLEATYLFPVPRGASVHEFAMWVNGEKVSGELLKSDDARKTYTDIVRRTQDPGLLEYVNNGLMRLRVFPIPPHGEQKVTLSYTSVNEQDNGAIEYVYPLKGEGKAASEGFELKATIKSARGVQSVYSPSHAIQVKQKNEHEATIHCEPKEVRTDKDFALYYSLGDKDVGMTALTYRPVSDENGHFLLLLTPKVELSKTTQIPRDVVLVLDTSGSMRGVKMEQARKALNYCLKNLNAEDRFGVINFCSTVNKYRDNLVEANRERIEHATKWVNKLEATSGTAINDALQAALEMRQDNNGRTFTIVFFTDGMPTEGECNPDKIIQNVMAKNTTDTRIFTFGVGDDVNATLLDQLAEQTRAVSTFVRPSEDIESKCSALYDKISHPVLANLKLKVSPDVQINEQVLHGYAVKSKGDVQVSEVYPPHLPDLFHGGQVVVLGKYDGHGPAKVTLTGMVGKEKKEFVYEMKFDKKTGEEKAFVEQLWARRKVGYLLDQIRANGEKKELVDEVTSVAKKHGIATPYTSYLVAPDAGQSTANNGQFIGAGQPVVFGNTTGGPSLAPAPPAGAIGGSVLDPANATPGSGQHQLTAVRGIVDVNAGRNVSASGANPKVNYAPVFVQPTTTWATPNSVTGSAAMAPGAAAPATASMPTGHYLQQAPQYAPPAAAPRFQAGASNGPALARNENLASQLQVMQDAATALRNGDKDGYQSGRVGVELSLQLKQLREQSQLDAAAMKRVGGRSLRDVGGAWVDDGLAEKTKLVEVQAMSAAYFRILEKHPEMAEVFRLGNRVVWVTPSGAALVIDVGHGKEELGDKEIEGLFVAKE